MLIAKPKILPRLDFDDGIPLECRTLVVVPTVISTPDDVDRLLEMLEVRYLGNRDAQTLGTRSSRTCRPPRAR